MQQKVEAGLEFIMLDRNNLKNESKYFANDLHGGLECKTDSTLIIIIQHIRFFAQKLGTTIHTNTEVTI